MWEGQSIHGQNLSGFACVRHVCRDSSVGLGVRGAPGNDDVQDGYHDAVTVCGDVADDDDAADDHADMM